ncbi:unnamed protein product [Plutella xylostella]|uniref:(diamondback moth) hypothetical protein n=1 Tax=Plutella xylostella TaxID=51655 RepID=A0A8S4FVP7_PLUXY|nr:unnamed protein product [Plutella xylostella]
MTSSSVVAGEWRGERRMLDITRDKPVKVCVRVVVPVRDHPKFNFVGKLLGPKGNSLKRLQEDTMCKMAVLGRGSMKDRQKEEELRVSGDPKFAHLSDELHVEISAFATPAEAHARIAYALAELRRFLVPDYNDDIRQEQMLEMQILSSVSEQARRLTPPASSHSGSEEALPAAAANKHRHRVSVSIRMIEMIWNVSHNRRIAAKRHGADQWCRTLYLHLRRACYLHLQASGESVKDE